MSNAPGGSERVTVNTQYGKLAEDWRHINTMIWGVPAVAISIVTGLIFAAYQPQLEGWPRILSLGLGALLLFALTVEVIKKRLLMSSISGWLRDLEKHSGLAQFPSSTSDLIKYADTPENPDEDDPVYKLFKWSYARQYLTYVTFVAGILVSILTEWEFVKYFHDKQWWVGYLAGIIPVFVISTIIVIIVRLRRRQEEKWIRTEFWYKHSKPKITEEAKEVKVSVNMRNTPKDKIKVNAYHNTVVVTISDSEKNCRKTTKLPSETDIETAKSTLKEKGMLEITFDKKVEKPKGKPIEIK